MEDKFYSQKSLYDFIIRNFKPKVYAYHVVQLLQGMPAADVEPAQKWAPVTDAENLPKRSMPCLVACNQWGGEKVRKATYLDSEKIFMENGHDITEYVTHWMPSPKPPEDKLPEKKPRLENCPFCGGKAETHNKVDVTPVIDQNGAYVDADTLYYEWTGCPACDIWINLTEDEPEGTTVKKWNRRVRNAG